MDEKVFDFLDSKGFDVYFPGQKKGSCDNSHVVVKDSGQNHFAGTNQVGYLTIDLYIYVPLVRYTVLRPMVANVKKAMKGYIHLKPSGNESPSMIDDKKEAHFKKIEYIATKKL